MLGVYIMWTFELSFDILQIGIYQIEVICTHFEVVIAAEIHTEKAGSLEGQDVMSVYSTSEYSQL